MQVGPIVGVLLAGGRSSRMGGGDKCLLRLSGRPLLAHAIERLRPQVETLVLNANGDPSRFASFGLRVVADSGEDFAGPLAGVLAGMEWAKAHQPDARCIVTAATDTPFFPAELVARLRQAVAVCACALFRPRARRGAPQGRRLYPYAWRDLRRL
jgi:molybdopterin-guanine dinucleotide biosynthesis protein A